MPKAGLRDLPGTSFSLVLAPRRPSTKQSPASFGTAGNNPQRSSFIPHAREVMPPLAQAEQALLRSQSGPHAAAWLTAIPTDPGTTLSPEEMQVALRRRLRLPLPLASRHCGGERGYGGGAPSDPFGDHATACHRTGLLALSSAPKRGGALEPRLLLPHAHLADCPIAPHAVPSAPGHVLWVAAALVGALRLCGAACRGDERHLGAMRFHPPTPATPPCPLAILSLADFAGPSRLGFPA